MTLAENIVPPMRLVAKLTLATRPGLLLAAVETAGRPPLSEASGHLLLVEALEDFHSTSVECLDLDDSVLSLKLSDLVRTLGGFVDLAILFFREYERHPQILFNNLVRHTSSYHRSWRIQEMDGTECPNPPAYLSIISLYLNNVNPCTFGGYIYPSSSRLRYS